jgi:rare lipoprotein A
MATAFALIPVACGSGGQAQISAPRAGLTTTTDPEPAASPTSAVEPATEAATPPSTATGSVGSTTVDEGRAVQSVPAPSATIPSNSIANGPLPATANSGTASWYETPWGGLTTASRDYAKGTRLNVCHGGVCVQVVVNDYGPQAWTGRALDLSSAAFAVLAPLSRGVIPVSWGVLT